EGRRRRNDEICLPRPPRSLPRITKTAIFAESFSYDRVSRVGPSGPALFYFLNGLHAPRHIEVLSVSNRRTHRRGGPTQPVTVILYVAERPLTLNMTDPV